MLAGSARAVHCSRSPDLALEALIVADACLDDERRLARRVPRLEVARAQPRSDGLEIDPFRDDDHARIALVVAASPPQRYETWLSSRGRDVIAHRFGELLVGATSKPRLEHAHDHEPAPCSTCPAPRGRLRRRRSATPSQWYEARARFRRPSGAAATPSVVRAAPAPRTRTARTGG